MSNTWNQWEGQIVDGKFALLRYLGASKRGAVYLTERQENGRSVHAAIKLVPASTETGELQLSRWQQSAELTHPHLIPLFDSGWVELDGVLFVYLVMECAEENLSQVLPERALTATEARQMLESVLDVLAYLHGQGVVHGGIKPANIMASGDQLKVSNDALHRVGETHDSLGDPDAYAAPEYARGATSASQPMSSAGDVWSLGMTLVETLTQNLPDARTAEQQDSLISATLPEPFFDIARHCLVRDPQRRWTIAQISDRLQGRAPAVQLRIAATPEPKAPALKPPPRPAIQRSRPPAQMSRYAVPIAIGFVLVLAAVLAGPRILRHPSEVPQAPAVADERPAVPPAPSKPKPSPMEHPVKSSKANFAEEEPSPKAPVPVPAVIHPETIREEATNTVARSGVGTPAHGEVAHRAMPEVLQSARNSIRGTVRVMVKVNVDRAGNVEDAELAARGPSKYFARAALDAARLWKFNPPKIGGRGVLSSWILQFEFTRDETTVVPTQELP